MSDSFGVKLYHNGATIPGVMKMARTEPLSKYAAAIAKRIKKDNLDGVQLCRAKKQDDGTYKALKPYDMGAPLPLSEKAKGVVIFVEEGGGGGGDAPAPPPAPAPAGDGEEKKEEGEKKKKVLKKPAKPKSSPKSEAGSKKDEAASKEEKKSEAPAAAATPSAGSVPAAAAAPAAAPDKDGPGTAPALTPNYKPGNAGLSEADEVRKQLVEFYMRHNPVKLTHISQIMESYKGQEKELLRKVKEKYEKSEADGMAYYKSYALNLPSMDEMDLGEATPEARAIQKLALEVKVAEAKQGKEKLLRQEEENMLREVKAKFTAVNKELEDLKRREALEREERDMRERRDREEREMRSKREFERTAQERRALEDMIRDREHAQETRQKDLQQREEEIRRQRDELKQERALLRQKELDNIERTEDERNYLKDRVGKMISMIAPATPAPATPAAASPALSPDASVMPKAVGVLASLQQEQQELKEQLAKLEAEALAPRHTTHLQDAAAAAASPALQVPAASQAAPASPEPAQADPPVDDASAAFRPVQAVLEKAGLEKYAEHFKAHDFNLQAFSNVTDSDLKELGINGIGARKRLVAEAQRQKILFSAGAPHAQPPTVSAPEFAPPAPAPYWTAAPVPPVPAAIPPQNPKVSEIHRYTPDPAKQATQAHLGRLEQKMDHLAGLAAQAQPVGVPPAASPPPPLPRQFVPPPPLQPSAMLAPSHTPGLEWHRDLLTRFYQTFDPAKLPQVGRILSEYSDRLGDLYRTLGSVYEIEGSPYAEKVWRVCSSVTPGREVASNVLCRLCKGREAELMEHLLSEGTSVEASLLDQVARWTQQDDAGTGRTYYYSDLAREAQWSKPSVLIHRDSLLEQGIANVAKVPSQTRVVPFSSLSQNPGLPPNPSPYESANYQPATANAERARATHYRAWLLAYFMKNDPQRVPEVGSILARYAGAEELMVSEVRQQYEGYASG